MVKRFLVLLCLYCSAAIVVAQYDVHFNNYWLLKSYYNPSYNGMNDRINIMGTYSLQMLGYEGAPKSMYFGGDLPFRLFGKKQGAGVGFFNETIGMFKNLQFWAQYCYMQPIGKGTLAIGLRLGSLNISFDPTDIVLGDENMDDPAFPTSQADGKTVELGTGIFYEHPLFWTGISASHLTMPSVKLGDISTFEIKPTFYFMGGGNIKTKNPLISIQPSMMFQTDFLAYRCDLSTRVTYFDGNKQFYGGISYSPTISVSFMFGAVVKDFVIGYAYEMFTGKVGIGAGNHDLFLSYSLDMSFSKKSKNKHKSIRIL